MTIHDDITALRECADEMERIAANILQYRPEQPVFGDEIDNAWNRAGGVVNPIRSAAGCLVLALAEIQENGPSAHAEGQIQPKTGAGVIKTSRVEPLA